MSEPAEEAFRAMWDAHYRSVLAYGLRRDPGHAQDLAADVFLVAWRRLSDIPQGAELPWLLAVARNLLANHRRGARRAANLVARLRDQPPAPAALPEGAASPQERAAFAGLSAADREVLALNAWEGLEGDALGRVLGCSGRAAAMRLHRARTRLDANLAGERAAPDRPTTAREAP